MKKRFLSLLLASVMVLGSLTACGIGEENKDDTTVQETIVDEQEKDKILRVATEDPQVPLDMHLYTYSMIMKITDNVCESLLLTNAEGELEPVLLTDMPTLSEDKRTYTFELKEGVKFHNGAVLTSRDVKYSLERMISKAAMPGLLEQVEGYEPFLKGETKDLEGIELIDDTHFNIHLAEIYTPLLSVLATPYTAIYPAEACEMAGENWGMTELYGTGPFKLVSYETGVGAELVKFDDYHGGEVNLDRVTYQFMEDPWTAVFEYKKGNIDLTYMDAALYKRLANDKTVNEDMHSFQPIGGYYLTINSNVITDPKVREAMTYAVDRTALCEGTLFGAAEPNSNFLPENMIGGNPEAEQFEYNPEKSKALLAEAGYTEVIAAGGCVYEFELVVNTAYGAGIYIAKTLQSQMKDAGFKVDIRKVDNAVWMNMKAGGLIEVGLDSWYADYNDPNYMLYPVSDSCSDTNSIFWHNDEFKSLMIEGAQTEDIDERQQIYARADQILTHEEFGVVALFNETMFYLTKPYVEDFEVTSSYRTMLKNVDIVQ